MLGLKLIHISKKGPRVWQVFAMVLWKCYHIWLISISHDVYGNMCHYPGSTWCKYVQECVLDVEAAEDNVQSNRVGHARLSSNQLILVKMSFPCNKCYIQRSPTKHIYIHYYSVLAHWSQDKMVTLITDDFFLQKHFLEWKFKYFDSNFTEISSQGSS